MARPPSSRKARMGQLPRPRKRTVALNAERTVSARATVRTDQFSANDKGGADEIDLHMAEFAPVTDADLPAIKEIYDHYILTTTATFHETPVSLDELPGYVPVDDPKHPSFAIRSDGSLVGFCSCSPYKRRSAYDRTVELSVYLSPGFTGRGLGTAALARLESAATAAGICVMVGTVCGENSAGIRLMERCDYTRCGCLRNVGEKFGRTLDVVLYQKELSHPETPARRHVSLTVGRLWPEFG